MDYVLLAFLLAHMFVPLLVFRAAFSRAFRSIGTKRLLLGHFAVAVAGLAIAAVATFRLALLTSNVPIEQMEWSRAGGVLIYFFAPTSVFTSLFLAAFLIPLSLWLSSHGKASIPAFIGYSAICVLGVTMLLAIFPNFGPTLPFEPYYSKPVADAITSLIVCLAFGLGIRFPPKAKRADNAI